jgi:hypothetical protein
MATTTNYSWTTPDDTALVKDGAAAIRSLGTAIDTTVFNNASAAIAKTIVDAKGDIIAATAADTVSRLAVGANDTVLTADSTAATGLKWATVAAGSLTLLSTTSLTGSSVTVSSISQSYKNLFCIFRDVYCSANNKTLYMSASSLNASMMFFGVDSTTLQVESQQSDLYMTLAKKMSASNYPNSKTSGSFTITNYATTAIKTVSGTSIAVNDDFARSGGTLAGHFYTASALTAITVYLTGADTFSSGSLLIYGVN